MKTLIMAVAEAQAGDWPLKQLNRLGAPNTSDPTRWSVEAGKDWIAVSYADGVRQDYEPVELIKVVEKIGNAKFYLLESREADIMACYIQMLPNELNLLIDNDHGWIASAKEYKEAIVQNFDWLYTKATPLLKGQLGVA